MNIMFVRRANETVRLTVLNKSVVVDMSNGLQQQRHTFGPMNEEEMRTWLLTAQMHCAGRGFRRAR